MRLLRAMQIPKPLLLEGSPGVGKTSLVAALAAACGARLVRINLSEQTDMIDLMGADLPAEGAAAGEFHWSDGALWNKALCPSFNTALHHPSAFIGRGGERQPALFSCVSTLQALRGFSAGWRLGLRSSIDDQLIDDESECPVAHSSAGASS